MVFYRKYRPQLISELDLVQVREKLTAILSSKEIPHAFLFAGPKGLGKTSSARILAKAINCENRKKGSVEPCNTCSACISITNGSAVDVLEIDAASNRGIDEIRDLKERIKFSPSSLKKKIYIIDEVHMLTTEAFNALLKTLEEPPPHVVFILATTEIGKLPGTILSRVFLVQFDKPSSAELARSLSRVAQGENLELEEKVLDKIAELSDGAFRDGAKILEELSLQSKAKKITLELFESQYKTGSIDVAVQKLIDHTLQKDAKSSLTIINDLSAQNTDFKLVIEKMAGKLHDKLIDLVMKGASSNLQDIQKFLGLLDEAYKGLKGAVLPQLPLEIAVIEFSLGQGMQPQRDNTQETMVKTRKESVVVASQPTVSPKPQNHTVEVPAPVSVPVGGTNNSHADVLKKLVDLVNIENKILAGLIRGCKVEDITDSTVTIKASSAFHLGKLTEPKNKQILESSLREILQKEVAITIKT